jgi:hypothetical protein
MRDVWISGATSETFNCHVGNIFINIPFDVEQVFGKKVFPRLSYTYRKE